MTTDSENVTTDGERKLYLNFHGRIIDSLGIQMYQSPVAAIAELIANAWDADATAVAVTLPTELGPDAEIIVRDDGGGMTFLECQQHYLNVGRNRRLEREASRNGRPLLGRKGIGKFAGFGIARVMEIETVSVETGERTVFRLDLDVLRSEEFVSSEKREIDVLQATGPDDAVKPQHGTTIKLKTLALSRRPTQAQFNQSMARRFVFAQASSGFAVAINGNALPPDADPIGNPVEFVFPRDYAADEKPEGLNVIADGWAEEVVSGDHRVQWQVKFTGKPIGEEEFRGVAIYCGIKVAQTPFFFQLSGGLAGQHGQQYMTGRVRADYLDRLGADVITTERQRINWEDPQAKALLEWGQTRVKQLLQLWQARRAEAKLAAIDARLAGFSERLAALPPSEAKVVKQALRQMARIGQLDDERFQDLARAILTAWEGGRLQEIIREVARLESMEAGPLLGLLAEQQVLTTLHVGEAVRLKADVIEGLKRRIRARELENAIRNYIAKNPWLIAPEWETFAVERRIDKLAAQVATEAGVDTDNDWDGRVDLTLSSGDQLLVLEFMRPGLTVDRDHINRFQLYMDTMRARVGANTGLGFRSIRGMLVADKLHIRPQDKGAIDRMAADGMVCREWEVLLGEAEAKWSEFLDALAARSPDDARVRSLALPPPAAPEPTGGTTTSDGKTEG
ncbi:ATP-binding protein [Aquabacterium sp. J223]|uniref:ATP-binding protein n=1 Tax=Aquabacterium sp. J223 TaxID=2898431 RepID=UPI0021AE1871|nr:ATP-binding protein [Aquabacterium sp. J223]UUX96608.1 ATP-binding protein [Aquabacterium sp. J223]